MAKYDGGKSFWGLFGVIVFCHVLGGALIVTFANTHTWLSGTVEYTVGTNTYKLTIKELSPTRYNYDSFIDDAQKLSVENFFYWDATAGTSVTILSLAIQQVLFTIGGGFGLWTAIMYAFGARYGRFAVPVFAKASVVSTFASMIAGGALYFYIAYNFYNQKVVNFDNKAGGVTTQQVRAGFKAAAVSARFNDAPTFSRTWACTGWDGGSNIYLGDGTHNSFTPYNCKSNGITLGYSMILVIIGIGIMGIGSILGFIAHLITCTSDGGNELGDGADAAKSAIGSAVDDARSGASDLASAASNLSISGSINISVDVDVSAGSS
jgi:hypothetical protein